MPWWLYGGIATSTTTTTPGYHHHTQLMGNELLWVKMQYSTFPLLPFCSVNEEKEEEEEEEEEGRLIDK